MTYARVPSGLQLYTGVYKTCWEWQLTLVPLPNSLAMNDNDFTFGGTSYQTAEDFYIGGPQPPPTFHEQQRQPDFFSQNLSAYHGTSAPRPPSQHSYFSNTQSQFPSGVFEYTQRLGGGPERFSGYVRILFSLFSSRA